MVRKVPGSKPAQGQKYHVAHVVHLGKALLLYAPLHLDELNGYRPRLGGVTGSLCSGLVTHSQQHNNNLAQLL